MSETALVPQVDENRAIVPATDDNFDLLSRQSDFNKRLTLYTYNSKAFQEGAVKAGSFGLVGRKDDITELGPQVDVLVLAWRPKAVRMTAEAVLNYYDPNDPEFQKIKLESEAPGLNGVMAGPEFLLYIPALKCFSDFLMASKTMKGDAPKVRSMLIGTKTPAGVSNGQATFMSKPIKSPKYSWHGMRILPCSVALELPAQDKIDTTVYKFMHPKSATVETVAEGADNGRER